MVEAEQGIFGEMFTDGAEEILTYQIDSTTLKIKCLGWENRK